MVWLLVVGIVVVGAVVGLLIGMRHDVDCRDLGAVSDHWIAQHRADARRSA
jgi:hypothetical protein